MKKEMNNKGFSLVELIIVIAIMAVLVGILAPQYLKYVNNSKVSTDISNGQNIATTIQTMIADSKLTADVTTPAELSSAIITELGATPVSKLDSTAVWTVTYTCSTGVVNVYLAGFEVYPNPQAELNPAGTSGGYETKYKK